MDIRPENKRDIKYMPDNMLKTLLQYTMNHNYSHKERYTFWIKWQGKAKQNINEMKTITMRQSKIDLINTLEILRYWMVDKTPWDIYDFIIKENIDDYSDIIKEFHDLFIIEEIKIILKYQLLINMRG